MAWLGWLFKNPAKSPRQTPNHPPTPSHTVHPTSQPNRPPNLPAKPSTQPPSQTLNQTPSQTPSTHPTSHADWTDLWNAWGRCQCWHWVDWTWPERYSCAGHSGWTCCVCGWDRGPCPAPPPSSRSAGSWTASGTWEKSPFETLSLLLCLFFFFFFFFNGYYMSWWLYYSTACFLFASVMITHLGDCIILTSYVFFFFFLCFSDDYMPWWLFLFLAGSQITQNTQCWKVVVDAGNFPMTSRISYKCKAKKKKEKWAELACNLLTVLFKSSLLPLYFSTSKKALFWTLSDNQQRLTWGRAVTWPPWDRLGHSPLVAVAAPPTALLPPPCWPGPDPWT